MLEDPHDHPNRIEAAHTPRAAGLAMSWARPTGTVTFLFTDIEGSTRLWDDQGDVMAVALARHDEIVRGAIEAHDGYVFATGGDGFCAAFQWAIDAVAAAVAAQRLLRQEPWVNGVALAVRMGLHTGSAQERNHDYYGPTVNRAARIMGKAHGGQILAGSGTAGLVAGVESIELIDLGEHLLRDLSNPMWLFQVWAPGLACDTSLMLIH